MDTPTTGPAASARKPYVHDMTRFNAMVELMWKWRSADHEDNTTISRNDVIELLEGIEQLRRDLAAFQPKPIAWDDHSNRYYAPVEKRAKEIYDAFVYDGPEGTTKPKWQDGCNGNKCEEARELAREELRAAGHAPLGIRDQLQ